MGRILEDEATSEQRKILDEWERLSYRGPTLLRNNRIYCILNPWVKNKKNIRYGVYGGWVYLDLKRQVLKMKRAESRRLKREATINVGECI